MTSTFKNAAQMIACESAYAWAARGSLSLAAARLSLLDNMQFTSLNHARRGLQSPIVLLPDDYTTPREVATRLRITRAAVYAHLRRGDIPSSRVGRLIRIRARDVIAYLDQTPSKSRTQHRHGGPSA